MSSSPTVGRELLVLRRSVLASSTMPTPSLCAFFFGRSVPCGGGRMPLWLYSSSSTAAGGCGARAAAVGVALP
eukprot:9591111-Alexandrium_andersonii.AAC.1